MPILLFFVVHWYLSLFAQTFLQHRYAAHASFTMSKRWEKFFFILTYIGQGSSYLSPRAYGIMHRMHHAYTDTDKDPHSPSYSKNPFDMMWKTRNIYSSIYLNTFPVDARFTKNVPDWPARDKFAHSVFSRLLWVAFYIAYYVVFATSPWMYLLLPIHFVMGPVHGVIINWYAHRYGNVSFKQDNTSKNLLRLDWLMMGEGYHNNHHQFPSRVNFGHKWYEFDPIYPIILFLNKIKVIKIKKDLPEQPELS